MSRCQKARVECIEHVARRRPTKSRSDGQPPNRIRDYDNNFDKLSAVVATMAPAPALQSALPSLVTLPSQVSEASHQSSLPAPSPSPSARTYFKAPILPAPGPVIESSVNFWDSISEDVSCLSQFDPIVRSISSTQVQMLLDTYRQMVPFFPFVQLPEDSTCAEFVRNRPVLLFAVITVASHESTKVQQTLSREFRKFAMVRIMKGEKTLDLLQGLLVFLAWHHQYMDMQAVSVPTLLQLCIGIARDLGLDRISTKVRSPLQRNDTRDREAKRTYLGCYYLASNLGGLESGRSRSISYSMTLRNYASDLASAWEHKSDAILPIIVDICQFREDIEETFQSEQALLVRSQLKRLSDKWEHIRSASKLQANDYCMIFDPKRNFDADQRVGTLHWTQLAARIHLYKTAASVELMDRESTPWLSGFQLSLRVTYLRSIEQFLENSVQLSTTQYASISLVDWLHLVSGITGLSKLGIHSSPMPGWDPVELRIAKTFELFRDQLSSLMPRPPGSHEKNEDAFERFRRITALMNVALRNAPGGGSPESGTTFELATGSGRKVSLLHDVSLPKMNGMTNGAEKLPSLWEVNPSIDMTGNEFHWRFLMGTV